MRALKFMSPSPAQTHRSIPLLLACGSLALSACAHRPPPQIPGEIPLTTTLRTSQCLDLRGRLPDPDRLTIGGALDYGTNETAFGECEHDRAENLVGVVDEHNAAVRAAAAAIRARR